MHEPVFVRFQLRAGLLSWEPVKRFTHSENTQKPGQSDLLERTDVMKFNRTIQQAGATGYILLWILGIPIPILLLIFLLRGCT
jgi:hypothetical protein